MARTSSRLNFDEIMMCTFY